MCDKCMKCRYSTPIYLDESDKKRHACGYNLKQYTPRPCPPGEGCTVYEERDEGARNEWL